MNEHIFLCINATNQRDVGGFRLFSFPDVAAADAHIRDWLTRSCGLDCYCAGEETALWVENGGALPETAFQCPVLTGPGDLEGYNGFHSYDSLGVVTLFVSAIYDVATAAAFRKVASKEFGLETSFSEEADEMMDMLLVLERSFQEPLDTAQAVEKVDKLLANQGLSLF